MAERHLLLTNNPFMLLLLLLFFGVASFATADIFADVTDLSNALATASAPPFDSLEELGQIATKIPIMLKGMGPIGALVATSAKIGFPEDSTEFRLWTLCLTLLILSTSK
uniref:Uncharacterized protein n=1 Tax=Globodera rostochiensis TaxID=31243 RepID=A0A914HFK6_GLORO